MWLHYIASFSWFVFILFYNSYQSLNFTSTSWLSPKLLDTCISFCKFLLDLWAFHVGSRHNLWCLITAIQTHLVLTLHQHLQMKMSQLSWSFTKLSFFLFPFSSLLSFFSCSTCSIFGAGELIGHLFKCEAL